MVHQLVDQRRGQPALLERGGHHHPDLPHVAAPPQPHAGPLLAVLQHLAQTVGQCPDVAQAQDVENLIKTTVREWGSVDFLINNAGVTRDNLSIRMKEEEWDLVQTINLKGTFLCSQAAAKEMMKKASS